MKKMLIFIWFLVFHGNAFNQQLSRWVLVSPGISTVRQLLDTLSVKYEVNFSYKETDIPLDNSVKLPDKPLEVKKLLDIALKDTDIEFSEFGKQIILKKSGKIQKKEEKLNEKAIQVEDISLKEGMPVITRDETVIYQLQVKKTEFYVQSDSVSQDNLIFKEQKVYDLGTFKKINSLTKGFYITSKSSYYSNIGFQIGWFGKFSPYLSVSIPNIYKAYPQKYPVSRDAFNYNIDSISTGFSVYTGKKMIDQFVAVLGLNKAINNRFFLYSGLGYIYKSKAYHEHVYLWKNLGNNEYINDELIYENAILYRSIWTLEEEWNGFIMEEGFLYIRNRLILNGSISIAGLFNRGYYPYYEAPIQTNTERPKFIVRPVLTIGVGYKFGRKI